MEFRSERAKAEYLAWYDEVAAQWPVPSETITVPTAFGSTFVRISGPKTARPLFLLPGGRSSSLMWILNIAALSASLRVYTPDNIMDQGRSIPTNEPRSADDFARWLDELLDALGLESPLDLGGLSFGGWISARYTLARPNRVRRVVLIAPGATVLPIRPIAMIRGLPLLLPFRWGTKQAVYWIHGNIHNEPAEFKAFLERGIDALMVGTRSYKLQTKMVRMDVLSDDELCRLSETPALLLLGENEKLYSAQRAARRIQAVAPRIRVELVAGAGHLVCSTHAAEVSGIATAFLNDTSPA